MDIIHLLPDSVANQIAAGEVVQRPASVIKELMENAVDAGASSVDVLVQDAGRTSIQVIDNGKGMSETDARLAFERHATSKIQKAEDLFTLSTMGFRGEALPSIAAVAQVRLTTRTADQQLGVQLSIEGSRLISQEVCSCPVGANFEVSNLFFNVPARRKFLKTNATEMKNISDEFDRIALVNHSISFTLSSNGFPVMNLPAGSPLQRIKGVCGKKLGEQLLPIDVDTTIVRITGYVGKPESSTKKNSKQFLFVNGRYMRHALFHYGVMDAFAHLIPDGDQVPYFIFLQVDPANIDVNIHPTKTEIKFENEQEIRRILQAAVRDALGKFNAVPTIDFDVEGKPDIPVFGTSKPSDVKTPQVQYNASYNPFKAQPIAPRRNPVAEWEKLYENATVQKDEMPAVPETAVPAEPVQQSFIDNKADLMEQSSHHYQYKGQYIMTAVQSGLMIVDQRRAHVRILYERYLRQMREQNVASQGLLFPELLELTPSDAAILMTMHDDVRALGFDVTPLGGGSFSIVGTPAKQANPVKVLQDMVEEVREREDGLADSMHHHLALVLARHNAIEIGEALTALQMENIIGDLFRCENPNLTPTGKPILNILQQNVIDKMF